MATQLVPSIGAIFLTVTSQGWQNALQKTNLLILGNRDTMHRYEYSYKLVHMDFSFGANMAGFCKASHICYCFKFCMICNSNYKPSNPSTTLSSAMTVQVRVERGV